MQTLISNISPWKPFLFFTIMFCTCLYWSLWICFWGISHFKVHFTSFIYLCLVYLAPNRRLEISDAFHNNWLDWVPDWRNELRDSVTRYAGSEETSLSWLDLRKMINSFLTMMEFMTVVSIQNNLIAYIQLLKEFKFLQVFSWTLYLMYPFDDKNIYLKLKVSVNWRWQ